MKNQLYNSNYEVGSIHYIRLCVEKPFFLMVTNRTAKNVMLKPIGHTIKNGYVTPTNQLLEGYSGYRVKPERLTGFWPWLLDGQPLVTYFGQPIKEKWFHFKDIYELYHYGDITLEHVKGKNLTDFLRDLTAIDIANILKDSTYHVNDTFYPELVAAGITNPTQVNKSIILEISKNRNSFIHDVVCWNDEKLVNRFFDEINLGGNVRKFYMEQFSDSSPESLEARYENDENCKTLIKALTKLTNETLTFNKWDFYNKLIN